MENRPGDLSARLLTSDDALERASQQLRATQQLCDETEAIGAGVLGELHGQREQLEATRDTLTGAQAKLDESKKLIRRMLSRTLANKCILAGIIVVLIGLIALIIYYQVKLKK